MQIPFNKPYLTGKETDYIKEAVALGKISGDGAFTQKCHQFFEQKYGFAKCFLTTSCTDALEMAAILLNIQEGDEVIAPSYTFVSTVNAFVLRGAKIVFADSQITNPNIDADSLETLISPKTKAILVVHYAGIACQMDKIMALASKYNLFIVEDAAHAIDSYYQDKPLGSIGHLSAFSFHETKNIIAGEGGMLLVNDIRFVARAEVIREKGTNRSSFFRGEIEKYNWVDIGSSFLPSEITAAFLYAQLENLEKIQEKRKMIWDKYFNRLLPLQNKQYIQIPHIPIFASNNAHLFYILCQSKLERNSLLQYLNERGILAVFHYLPLHSSPYYLERYPAQSLPNAERYAETLIRLPLFYELKDEEQSFICKSIYDFYKAGVEQKF